MVWCVWRSDPFPNSDLFLVSFVRSFDSIIYQMLLILQYIPIWSESQTKGRLKDKRIVYFSQFILSKLKFNDLLHIFALVWQSGVGFAERQTQIHRSAQKLILSQQNFHFFRSLPFASILEFYHKIDKYYSAENFPILLCVKKLHCILCIMDGFSEFEP